MIGKIPHMLDENWKMAWDSEHELKEEEESEAEGSGDETEEKAGWAVRAAERRLRSRLAWSAKNRKRKRWSISSSDQRRMFGQAEGTQSKYILLEQEESQGDGSPIFKALEVEDWISFKPEITYTTLSGKVAEKALKDLSVSYDVKEAARLTRAVQKKEISHGRNDELKLVPKAPPRLERLARKINHENDDDQKQKISKRSPGISKAAEVDPFDTVGTRLDIGLNSAGAEAEAEDIIEGYGDDGIDFDITDDFQDDEADEEKPNLDQIEDLPSDEDDNVDDEDQPSLNQQKKTPKTNDEDMPQAAALDDSQANILQLNEYPDPEHTEETQQPSTKKRPRQANTGLLTQLEVVHEIRAHAGRFKLRDLLNLYKPRIKELAANKDAIKRILKQVCDMSEDPVEGKVLVLKDAFRGPPS